MNILVLNSGSSSVKFQVIETDLAGNVLATLAVAGMTQPEGIAFSWDCRTMWLTGEPNQWRRFEMTS